MKVEKNFLLGALIGATVGATATLIFNPVEGRIMRKKVISGLDETAKEIKLKAPKLKAKANKATKKVVEKAAKVVKPARKKIASHSKEESEDKVHELVKA
jgi:gas vesicle protein